MIIVGYYGIGKSEFCKTHQDYIDLESKYFRSDNGWLLGNKGLERYIWLIEDLNADGKKIFVSSLKEVRDELLKSKRIDPYVDMAYIYPYADLKDDWLSRLYNRWKESSNEKDWYAYKRAIKNFESDIESLIKDKGNTLDYPISKEILDKYKIEDAIKHFEFVLGNRKEEDK